MSDEPPLRGTRTILVVVALAFVVSIVHYVDNVANYADYPQPPADAALPAPSDTVIALAWFVLTAVGAWGVLNVLRRRVVPAAVGLAFYSASGLIGVGHYTVPGATDMPWWRQAHVVADIGLGAAILALAALLFAWNRQVAAAQAP
ncbi:MAG: hypothetical protein QM621_06760 [Aeromicrobium sp.]|uniref:hypothetical protein n=1 Tax=Aeromicrobium sp. TaxID=1871063 RepID=UPI0039E71A9E